MEVKTVVGSSIKGEIKSDGSPSTIYGEGNVACSGWLDQAQRGGAMRLKSASGD